MVAALLALTSVAVAIKVNDATTSVVRVDLGDGDMTLVKFQVDFDQPVFFKKDNASDVYPVGSLFSFGQIPGISYPANDNGQWNNTGPFNGTGQFNGTAPTFEPPPNLDDAPRPDGNGGSGANSGKQGSGGGKMNWPKISIVGAGTANVRCSGMQIPNFNPVTAPDRQGPPDGLLVAPPTADPFFSIMNFLQGGLQLNNTFFENRWVALLPVMGPPQMNFTNCVISFPGSDGNGFRLVDSNSNVIVLNATFVMKPPACDFDQMVDAMSLAASVKTKVANFKNQNEIGQFMNVFKSLDVRESMIGCPALMESFVKLNKTLIQMPASKSCNIPHDDPNWKKDPCCNWELSMTQCCKPKSRFGPAVFIESFESNVIAAVCKSPAKVQGLISNFAAAQVEKQKLEGESSDPQAMYEKYGSFQNDCNEEIYDTRCTSNLECAWSGLCQNGKCAMDYSNPLPTMLKCYLSKMPAEVSVMYRSILGAKAKYNASEDEVADVLSKFKTVADCYGPDNSWQHRSQEIWDKDPATGNYVSTFVPGNQTGCLSSKSCNLNRWSSNTEEQCLQQTAGGNTHFCSLCQYGWCNQITQYSKCYLPIWNNVNECNNANGTQNQWGGCERNVKKEECLTGPFCDANNYYCDSYCSKAKTDGECPSFFDQEYGNNTCVRRSFSFQDCQNSQGTFHHGSRFEIGSYDTEDSCKAGVCDYWGVPRGSTPEQCRNTQYCTQGCRKCESSRGQKEFCLVDKTEESCRTTQGMNWSSERCQAFVSDSTACSSVNGTWINCSSYKSKSSCDERSENECRWNMWANCEDKAECEAAGQCDDWEFEPRYQREGNQESTGVCTYKPEQLWRCVNVDPSTKAVSYDFSTRTGLCVSSTIDKEEDCNNATMSMQWKSRAKNATQCYSQAKQCRVPKRGFSFMNATECDSCQGRQEGVYTWMGGEWKNGTLIPGVWEAVSWKTANEWKTLPDYRQFNDVLQLAISKVIALQLYESFNKRFTNFANIYKFIACACTKGGKDTCFDEKISVPLKSCSLDPNAGGDCSGVQIDTGMFGSDQVVSIDIDEVSASNFIAEGSKDSSLQKRAVGNSNEYAVIDCYNSIGCGQLVGNGKYIKFGSLALNNVTVCLDKDLNIDQDTASYPVLDFVKGEGDSLGGPQRVNVTEVGNQYCGSVSPFTSATWFPIRRIASFTSYPSSPAQSASSTSSSSQSAAPTSSLPSSDKRPFAYLSILICLFVTL